MARLHEKVVSEFMALHTAGVRKAITERFHKRAVPGKRRYITETALLKISFRDAAELALRHTIRGSVSNAPLVSVCKRIGTAILGSQHIAHNQRDAIVVGYALVQDVCRGTKKFFLCMQTKTPEGVPLDSPSFRVVCTDTEFLRSAVAAGVDTTAGVAPVTYMPRDWLDAYTGGYDESEWVSDRRLIHTFETDVLDYMTEENAPDFFRAVNAMQRVAYKVDAGVLDVLNALEGAAEPGEASNEEIQSDVDFLIDAA